MALDVTDCSVAQAGMEGVLLDWSMKLDALDLEPPKFR